VGGFFWVCGAYFCSINVLKKTRFYAAPDSKNVLCFQPADGLAVCPHHFVSGLFHFEMDIYITYICNLTLVKSSEMAKSIKTPGVYIQETSAFPGDIAPIASAVPAFVGYTNKAVLNGKDATNIPVRVHSLLEFESFFGGAFYPVKDLKKNVVQVSKPAAAAGRFFLYHSLELYFANGGTDCYIVSVGNYSATPSVNDFFDKPDAGAIRTEKAKGIDVLLQENEPTLLVVPDAMSLPVSECFTLQRYMLAHCAQAGDRFAILDVPGGDQARTLDADDVITVFRNNLHDNLKWGAAYYPWLHSAFLAGQPSDLMPPSGAIAGIYCMTDQQQGVFKAPANVSVNSVSSVAVPISDHQQEDLNTPLDGKAVNAIRAFTGRGILVWGARTLDGNSQDWRYVPVRRTVLYIEESIKNMLQSYALGANTSATWIAVKSIIANFLTQFWQQGGLLGAKPDDAFFVQVGLGITMTEQDIRDGFMNVTVGMAVTRPAEFVVVTMTQQMAQG
jgi:hypothetical protein